MEHFIFVCSRLADGFVSSVLLFVLTLIIAIPLGLLISFCTMSKFAPLSMLSKIIVWVLRGTPLMLQIFAIFYPGSPGTGAHAVAQRHIVPPGGAGKGHAPVPIL